MFNDCETNSFNVTIKGFKGAINTSFNFSVGDLVYIVYYKKNVM